MWAIERIITKTYPLTSGFIVGCERHGHESFSLSLFILAGESFGFDVVDGGNDVFDVVLELIHFVLGVGASMRRFLRRHRRQPVTIGVDGV